MPDKKFINIEGNISSYKVLSSKIMVYFSLYFQIYPHLFCYEIT